MIIELLLTGIGSTFIQHSVLDHDKLIKVLKDSDTPYYDLEEEGIISEDMIQFDAILENVKLELLNEDKDITSLKGKYIKTKDYYSRFIHKGDYIFGGDTTFYSQHFIIELKDGDVFDPKKVHLMKSDYELDFLPYAIIIDKIMYDDLVIESDSDYDYDTPGRGVFQQIIDYDLPYV